MKIVIIGADDGGAACAARLRRLAEGAVIIVIDGRAEISHAKVLREIYNVDVRPSTGLVSAYPGFVLLQDELTGRTYQEYCDILVDGALIANNLDIENIADNLLNGRNKADEILGMLRAKGAALGLRRLLTGSLEADNLEAAEIGLNEEALAQMAAPYIYSVLPIDSGFLKLIYNTTGRIYGFMAQAPDIAPFIDTMSALMAHGGNIHSLICLETFGSSRKLQTLGKIAQNVIEGRLHMAYPDQIDYNLDNITLLDVRSRNEFADDHLPNAINIPLNELRSDIYRLDTHKEIITICKSGKRAYIAAGILTQRGFKVSMLTGGMEFLRMNN